MSELADDGIPVTVTCRVLKLAREPYYRWLTAPVTDREWDEAHLIVQQSPPNTIVLDEFENNYQRVRNT